MNWPSYNRSLVRRGEILLGFDVISNWNTELQEMNKDVIGIISYPIHFISCCDMLKYILVFYTDRPKKVLHKDTPMEKYLIFLIILQ
ncbi:MAG TPA: hypothetical protein VIY08_15660 [Candidatus Nitrosocosmicus sp.]